MKIIIETRPGAAGQWVAEATWAGCEAPVRAVSCDPAQAVVWAAERARFDISTAHNLPPVHPAHPMAAQAPGAPPRAALPQAPRPPAPPVKGALFR